MGIFSWWDLNHLFKCISLKEVILIHLTLLSNINQQVSDFNGNNTGYVFLLKNKIHSALVLGKCHSSLPLKIPLVTFI